MNTSLSNLKNLDWDDLRVVLEVARSRSASAASLTLGVSLATTLRKIAAAEKFLDYKLFLHHPNGLVATRAGQAVADLSARFSEAISETSRRIEAQNASLGGEIRFTTTDSLGHTVVPEVIAKFRNSQPDIHVDFIVTNDLVDLEQGLADVALRPTTQPDDGLIGVRLFKMQFGMFAKKGLVKDRNWQACDFIAPEGKLEEIAAVRWLNSNTVGRRPAFRSNSFLTIFNFVTQGVGVGLLPLFMVGSSETLECVSEVPIEKPAEIWLLTHEELRQSKRVNLFMTEFAREFRKLHKLFQP